MPSHQSSYDAVIVGSGPNGLAAGIYLARRGLRVKIFEAGHEVGGGTRTAELTLEGFKHDVCSAVHPLAAGSPFLQSLPLEEYGLDWIHPGVPLAHPLDNGQAVILHRNLNKTAGRMGSDRSRYIRLFKQFTLNWEILSRNVLAPAARTFSPLSLIRSPLLMTRFGFKALQPAASLSNNHFQSTEGRALFTGLAAHSIVPLTEWATSAIGIVLGSAAHVVGWPFPRGGSHAITQAMASYFRSLGGSIETGSPVSDLAELPPRQATLFNLTPKQILSLAASKIPDRYVAKLEKFRYGPGVFKMDLALDGPIPWQNPECRKAGTLHLGGTADEIVQSEQEVGRGKHPEKPFVLLAQHSLFDDTRAPEGRHTAWAYCHVPNGSNRDMTDLILDQIERFAPGIRERILDIHTMNTRQLHAYNANYIGGDINGGRQDIGQLFKRPARIFDPYRIPGTSMYIASSSTPPGGGVHGMCGYHCARSVEKHHFK